MDDLKKKWFIWGILLAWLPWIPVGIGFIKSFKGVSEQKAIGLGAIAGGFAEVFLVFGLGAILLFEVAGIVLLLKTFSREHRQRSFFSAVSICFSVLMIFVFGLFVWLFFFQMPHMS